MESVALFLNRSLLTGPLVMVIFMTRKTMSKYWVSMFSLTRNTFNSEMCYLMGQDQLFLSKLDR